MSTYKRTVDRRKERKELLVKGFGGKCQICGYDKCITALEFHHINPELKDINFYTTNYSWERIINECKKCICVCANCHREIHHGDVSFDTTKQYFNEDLVKDYDPTNLKKYYDVCPVCGKPKLKTHKYCSVECYKKDNNKEYTLEEIRYIINEINKGIRTKTDIAKELGISRTALNRRYYKWRNKI